MVWGIRDVQVRVAVRLDGEPLFYVACHDSVPKSWINGPHFNWKQALANLGLRSMLRASVERERKELFGLTIDHSQPCFIIARKTLYHPCSL